METPGLPPAEPLEEPRASERDVDDFARHIAETARPVDYEDRTSEAARDQGWGPIDVPPKPARPARTRRRSQPNRPVEYPSPGHNNNPEFTDAELTPEERCINSAGAAAAKLVLKQSGK